MRITPRSPLFWTAFIVAAVTFLAPLSCSSRHHGGRGSGLDTVAVNPIFVIDPPITEDVTVELLHKPTEEGNVLIKANFPKGRIGSPYLAFIADNKKIVLRDDGVSPDEMKEDNIYTGISSLDLEALRKSQAQLMGKGNEVQMTMFRGRMVTGIERISAIDLNRLLKGGILHLRFPLFPPSAALVDSLKANCVFVTAPSVVEDPLRTYDPCSNVGTKMGPWTFGFLMTQLANSSATGVSPSRFVLSWLLNYTHTQTVNGDPLSVRPNMDAFIHRWLVQSNGLADSALDLSIAPFRLLSIVNRLDLRSNTGYLGRGGNAGEGRFVFTGLDSNCTPMQFNVIFEYGINKTGCAAIKAYAQQWYNLKDLTVGSATYNTALQVITDQFTLANTNPTKPNGSSLDQLRTNEIQFGNPWELREFNIDSTTHLLVSTTVKQTMQTKFNNTALLDSYMVQHAGAIKSNTDIVPLVFHFHGRDTAFLAGVAPEPPLFWAEPLATQTNNDTVREMLSLNTCNGCHNIETGALFRQVTPNGFGSPATLSGFLTGTTVSGPAEIPGTWHFADLQRRAQDLAELVNSPCLLTPLHFRPLNMTH
jgi:hypothetical protein